MSIFERATSTPLEEAVRLGRDAKDILSRDGTLYRAMEEAEINFLEISVYSESADERDQARANVQALDGVIKELRRIQSDGEHAEKVIEQRDQ